MRKVNILILDGDMSRGGGTERMTRILSSLLSDKSDYSIYVVSLNPCVKSYYELDEKIQFVSLHKGRVPILSSIWQLYRLSKELRINLIINVDSFLSIYTIPLKLLCWKLKIVSWEMFNLENNLGIKWSNQLRQFALRWSDYYICLTQKDLSAFRNKFSIKKPITYIYNPCEIEPLDYNYDETSKKIVTAGHFFETKGFDLAVEVARLVLPKHKDWKWYFYGDGVELENVKGHVNEYQLGDQIIFAGRTKNISEIYENSAMYVMTSRLEGFGLVLLEAKCYNLPTIAFDCPSGPAEIIENDVSGFLIPSFNIKDMADRMEYLMTYPQQRIGFSLQASKNLRKFSKSSFLEQWINIIKELSI